MVDTQEILTGKIDDTPAGNGRKQEFRDRGRATTTGPEGSAVGGIVEAVKEQVQAAATGCADLAGKAKVTAQEWASAAGDFAVQAKDKVSEAASAAVDKVGDMGQDLATLIRRHPIKALLAGFGLGFLAARFLRRS